MLKFDHPIALVYCEDNKETALQIELDLKDVIDFRHFSCCKDEHSYITQMLDGFEGPILLLISDNYLRTAPCMQDGLSLLNANEDSILPIVILGFRQNEDGENEEVSTNFSRFKQIVQYINYWQDRYLALRKQKRNDPDLDNEGFAKYLHNIRDIAGEAGQYLRTLQTLDIVEHEQFSNNSYEVLFEFLGEDELWEAFSGEYIEEEESPADVNLEDIPGLELLESTPISSETTPVIETEEREVDENIEEGTTSKTKDKVANIIKKAWELDNHGEYNLAKNELNQAIKNDPENISLRYNLTVLHIQNGAYPMAKRTVNALLKISEEDEVLFLAGELADIQNKTKEALKYFNLLAKNNEDYPGVFYILGLLTQKMKPKATNEIEAYYKKALEKNKKNSFTSYELALFYLDNNEIENAKKFLKRTLKLDSNHPFAHYDLAILFHKNQAYKKANKHYQKAILITPELATEENNIAFSKIEKIASNEDTIQALKDKIEALEALLAEKG